MEDIARDVPKRPFRTLLAENEGRNYAEYGDERGKVRLWHLGGRIGIFESSGGINESHSHFIVRYFARHVDLHDTPRYAFGNWMELRGYTPGTRKVLMEWQKAMEYEGLFVAHNSKIVGMSINVANPALPTKVHVYNDEERLDDKLIEVRQSLGI